MTWHHGKQTNIYGYIKVRMYTLTFKVENVLELRCVAHIATVIYCTDVILIVSYKA